MRVRLISDTHFEFIPDWGRSFCESLDPTEVDVLILAGDITSECNEVGLSVLAKKFKKILYTFGNHEYYKNNYNTVLAWGRSLEAKYPNVKFLENDIEVVDGQRFLGTTLWTPDGPNNKYYEPLMNDFFMIEGGARNFIYSSSSRAIKFLEDNTQDGDFIITHHLPSQESIQPKWVGNKLNIFFANDLDHILYDKRLTMTFGHTHDSEKGKKIGHTMTYCNPRGYEPRNINPDFNPKFDIDL